MDHKELDMTEHATHTHTHTRKQRSNLPKTHPARDRARIWDLN